MTGNRYYSGPVSDHFDGERFFAPGRSTDKTLGAMANWVLRERRAPWPRAYPSPFFDRPPFKVAGGALRIAYIGHASFLIQTRGLNLLIDPVYAKRASPTRWAGPARVNAPGVAFDDLPPIDFVLVTHNHYDHLDLSTLSRLNARWRPRILTPLGNDAIIRAHDGALSVEAYDWGAEVRLAQEVDAHFLPSNHWSARGLSDRRMALWCSFLIETPEGPIYCIGDTGFGDGAIFRDVSSRFGPPRLALIPIGAYEPRWFMMDQHVNPSEAVRIFQLCGARQAVAHHWGTFHLSNEAIEDPPSALKEALREAAIHDGRFRVVRPGEVYEEAEV
ncbi:MAG TPA: MBL fold metallo-hydrolase [Roseiarcus sp.]|nr:MBL fold metallo-hydrolase [Roseiarcus sp.]